MIPYFLTLLFLIPVAAYGFNIDEVVERHEAALWHVGKAITPGDFFVYRICDGAVHPHMCYTMRLDFYANLLSSSGNMWIVQAEIHHGDDTEHHIFLVDSETFRITTDHAGHSYARSVEDTIFYLTKFAPPNDPKRLNIGDVWGQISPSLHNAELTVTAHDEIIITNKTSDTVYDQHQIVNMTTLDVAILEYWVFETSVMAVSPDLGLPVYALAYKPYVILDDPPMAFTLELLDYS